MKLRRTHLVVLLSVIVTLSAVLLLGQRRLDRHRIGKIEYITFALDNDKYLGITDDELLAYLGALNTESHITNGTLHIHYTSRFTNREWTVDMKKD